MPVVVAVSNGDGGTSSSSSGRGLGQAVAAADRECPVDAAGNPISSCPRSTPVLFVTPMVEVPHPVVLVKRPYTSPLRREVVLRTDVDFGTGGSGLFTVPGSSVRFFTAATAGVLISFSGTDNRFTANELARGVTLWAEGVSPSGHVDDIVMTLTISGGNRVPRPSATATGRLTAVRLTLDICGSRTTAGHDPPLLSADKVTVGRFLMRPTGTSTHHRGMLIVRQAEPADFPGTLLLTPVAGSSGRASACRAEDPVADPTALSSPHRMPAADLRHGPIHLWAEGSADSHGRSDRASFHLGIDGVDPDGDRVSVVVFSLNRLEAFLRATPCRRDGSRSTIMPKITSTMDSLVFDATAMVVVHGCGRLRLELFMSPNDIPVSWTKRRAADDSFSGSLPTDSAGADARHRDVQCDATGSFHLIAFVDDVGGTSTVRKLEEDGLVMNTTMVNIEFVPGAGNNVVLLNNGVFNSADSTTTQLKIQAGTTHGYAPAPGAYTDAVQTQFAFGLKAVVKLTGGGVYQRRGLDRVRLGYVQHIVSETFVATYTDGRTYRVIYTNSPAPGPGGPLPAVIAFPIHDESAAALSGAAAFITSSTDDARSALALGQQRTVRMIDCPGNFIDLQHPTTASPLRSIAGGNTFTAFLSAFSNDFDENFTVLGRVDWGITYGAYAPTTGWSNAGAGVTGPAAINSGGAPQQGESAGMERCTPNSIASMRNYFS